MNKINYPGDICFTIRSIFSDDQVNLYRDDEYELADSSESQSSSADGGRGPGLSLPDRYKNKPALCKVKIE